MAVGLSLVTLVSGMSISIGSAAAATQNTTSGQWVTTTVSKGNKITLPGIPASETCKFIINGDEGFFVLMQINGLHQVKVSTNILMWITVI